MPRQDEPRALGTGSHLRKRAALRSELKLHPDHGPLADEAARHLDALGIGADDDARADPLFGDERAGPEQALPFLEVEIGAGAAAADDDVGARAAALAGIGGFHVGEVEVDPGAAGRNVRRGLKGKKQGQAHVTLRSDAAAILPALSGEDKAAAGAAERLVIAAAKADHRVMRRALLALAAVLALPLSGGAEATSITGSPPHDPKLACKEILGAIKGLNAGRLKDPRAAGIGPTFYSDLFGEVEPAEEARFLHSLRHSEGKADRTPIGLYGVFTVHRDKDTPLYMAVLKRQSWHETELVTDDMGDTQEVANPGYREDTSFWLVGFWSNDLRTFREATELFQVMSQANQMKNCHRD